MNIDYKTIKEYLKNVYFINGTAFAGKSSVCKAISKKYGMYHCEENYNTSDFISLTTIESHPNMNYFNTMNSWEEFVSRSKEDYDNWLINTAYELAEFEIIELISLSRNQKVIVDTNIPHSILKEIASENHVVYMVATKELAMEEFFNRPDNEKQFLLSVIMGMKDSDKVLKNYKEIIAYSNRESRIDEYKNSCFPCIERKSLNENIEDKIDLVEKLFKLK